MLSKTKTQAPEPYFSAALALLYHVAIYVRARTWSPEHVTVEHIREINQLMDAIHNIPDSLLHYGNWYSEERMRETFEHFDSLSNSEDRLRLTNAFEEFLDKVRIRDRI
jgi:hypothetical protein